MKMEFIFNQEKLRQTGYSEEQCLSFIRNYFNEYHSKTIKEIRKGFFEGDEEKDWDAFVCTSLFPYHESWFLKVIEEWYWYVDEGDGLGEQKEDCLESYYKYKRINA